MDERLMMPQYTRLTTAERKQLLEEIGCRYQLTLREMAVFSRWGKSIETAVYDGAGSTFVFVPGAVVTLGWDGEDLAPEAREQWADALAEFEMEISVEQFLNECTTPLRQAVIGPMLVEQYQQEIGWEAVSLDDERIAADPNYQAILAKLGKQQSIEYVRQIRFERQEQGIVAAIYHEVTYDALETQLTEAGFALPTADEWEYFCGGGCRTLFPWGDSLPETLHLRYFEYEEQEDEPYTLEQPNFFGLVIGFDPYRREVLAGDRLRFKGGDGGTNVCGGLGPLLGYLSCSPYFSAWDEEEEEDKQLNGDYDFLRRIIRVA